MRAVWTLIGVGAIALGIAGASDVGDALTGWTLVGCGLIAWSRSERSWSGAVMTATGLAWFVPGLGVPGTLYLHRGPLVHLVLTYPRGWPARALERAAVAAGYAAALVPAIWRSPVGTSIAAAVLVGIAARDHDRAVGRERRARLYALRASAFTAAVLVVVTVARPLAASATVDDATLLGYEAALCALAIGLVAALMRAPWERSAVTDLVVELGETRSGTLRDALARELGDPTLEVGYRLADGGAYVDGAGRPLTLPAPGSPRRTTRLERGGQEIAVLVHDAAVLDDPRLLDALARAARLDAANARLQAEVRAQVAGVRASRRRLLEAADEERRRLEARLSEGAVRRLASLENVLGRARERARGSTADRIAAAHAQLHRTRDALDDLAAGLHPRELVEEGLPTALRSLADRSPVPVALEVVGERMSARTEACAFFVCSEALANAAKHAAASRIAIAVRADGRVVRIRVADDGVGGADISAGSGLRGLADRVQTLGGTLTIESEPGRGTRLVAEVPLDGDGA